jgi:hypothetical protein
MAVDDRKDATYDQHMEDGETHALKSKNAKEEAVQADEALDDDVDYEIDDGMEEIDGIISNIWR